MDTMQAITSRKSTRAYTEEQVPEDALTKILQAGMAAPVASAKYDSLHITVVQDGEMVERISAGISKALNWDRRMFTGTPTLIFLSSTPPQVPGIEYANAGCVLENMLIAATAQNVDSLLFGGAVLAVQKNADLRKALAIPEGFEPVLSVALGYAQTPGAPAKEHTIAINRIQVGG